MRRIAVASAMLVAAVLFCSTSYALFVTEPKDTKVTKKEVKNEDGTTTTVEEYDLKDGALDLPNIEEIPKVDKYPAVKHSKGLETRSNMYKPREAPYTVVKAKPKDWPIPISTGNAAEVPKIKEETSRGGVHWFVTLVCLGIIAFAATRIVIHMREIPDPNKV